MAAQKPKVVVTRKLPDPVETRMRELFDTELNVDDKPLSADELVEAMSRADVLVPTITDVLDARTLARAGERLKLIANFGAGVDNIDVATANQRNIIVTNTPGVLTEDTADMTMSLIMAASRRVVEGANVVQGGGFQGWSPTWMLGRTPPAAIRTRPKMQSRIVAYLRPDALASLDRCKDGWCRIKVEKVSGWVPARAVWGATDAPQCR